MQIRTRRQVGLDPKCVDKDIRPADVDHVVVTIYCIWHRKVYIDTMQVDMDEGRYGPQTDIFGHRQVHMDLGQVDHCTGHADMDHSPADTDSRQVEMDTRHVDKDP